ILIAAGGLYLTEHGDGAYWDGLASIMIGVVLAIVAFVLARASRGLLLGEAANAKEVAAIREAIESHHNVEHVVELLTMHLAPKQILINAHVKLKDNLRTDHIEQSILESEDRIKRAEPKVEMIFLEAARGVQADEHQAVAEHIG